MIIPLIGPRRRALELDSSRGLEFLRAGNSIFNPGRAVKKGTSDRETLATSWDLPARHEYHLARLPLFFFDIAFCN